VVLHRSFRAIDPTLMRERCEGCAAARCVSPRALGTLSAGPDAHLGLGRHDGDAPPAPARAAPSGAPTEARETATTAATMVCADSRVIDGAPRGTECRRLGASAWGRADFDTLLALKGSHDILNTCDWDRRTPYALGVLEAHDAEPCSMIPAMQARSQEARQSRRAD